ncbi:hypothetical protein D9Q98_008548 [Chlorella vulgaris]|uniref:K Homology domain-containing protein n=1 Tax=Chlorella vulgaris TaxID=3077 RepID=A0A9D4TI60_CHLVU|nr:hypothetical protein D9Q98_008548 [Chlorella vulgaris]
MGSIEPSSRAELSENTVDEPYARDEAPTLWLRLLCPQAKVAALIGKKGANISRIRQTSGAAVSVADPVLGCDERVVHITGESVDDESSSSAADALCAVFSSIFNQQQQQRGPSPALAAGIAASASNPASSANGTTASDAAAAANASSCPGSVVEGSGGDSSSASASTVGDHNGVGGSGDTISTHSAASGAAARPLEARMLVHSSAVGFLVGRGGSTIKETAALSGAGVRILSKSELPACACLGDEVVRVVGSATAVQAALQMLAGQLKAHLLRYGPGNNASTGGRAAVLDVQQMPYMPLGPQQHLEMTYLHPAMAGAAMYAAPGYGGAMQPPAAVMQAPGGFSGTAVEVTFRLLAPTNRTGNIIGKGGEHVRRLRAETGARVKVFDPAPGSEERVVALTSTEDALSPYCAAQDALIRCLIALTQDDAPGAGHRVRVLTAQASVGMVLGKRGATVSQLRQETGAGIKVLPADAVPPAYGGGLGSDDSEAELTSTSSGSCLTTSAAGTITGTGSSTISSNGVEEVIQLDGSVQQCVAALRGVATLLRGWQIRRMMAMQQHQFGSGPEAAAGTGMQQQQQQQRQQGQQHGLHLSMPVSPTAAGMMSPSSPGILGLPSSLGSLGSPVHPSFLMAAGPMQQHHQQQQQQHQQQLGVMLGHTQARGVTYVYHLNNAQVGAVLGKGGSHIAQIRTMTGARVQLQGDSMNGGRVLMVAGLPDQCHAAHNMANAFFSVERCEPAYPEPIYGG